MSAGVLEVKGNLFQREGTPINFYQSGTFKVILTGSEVVTVDIQSIGYLQFNVLDISGSTGVIFGSPICVNSIIGLDKVFNKDIFTLYYIQMTLERDEDLNCSLIINSGAYINLNGHALKINGDLSQLGYVNITLNGGRLIINGDYSIEGSSNLIMTNENDYVLVDGNFTMKSDNLHEDNLAAGILEIKGNVTQIAGNRKNFRQSGTFKLLLTGSKEVTVTIECSRCSRFNILDISGSAGVTFVNGLYTNKCKRQKLST